MKKFILNISFLLLSFSITGYLIHQLDIPSDIAKRINSIEEKIEILNLGNSHGNNFDYSECELNGINVNVNGNTLYYDLQNYLFLAKNEYLKKDAIIIIPVSYHSFGLSQNRADRLPDDSFVNDFYYYLPKEQIFEYSIKKKRNLSIFTIQQNINHLFAKPNKKDDYGNATDLDLEKHAIDRVLLHKKISNYSAKKRNKDYLTKLLEDIIKNNHIPILVTTPYYSIYTEMFGTEWLDENYYHTINHLSSKHNVLYLDYSKDSRLCYNPKYYYNSDHMNNNGKKAFSSIIFKDILNFLE